MACNTASTALVLLSLHEFLQKQDKLRTLSTAAYGGAVIGMFSLLRTACMPLQLLVGTVTANPPTGPIGHYFYHGMDKVVTRYFKIGTFGFVVAKVLGDELLFGPIHVGGYFAWMTLAEGGSWQVSFSNLSLP